MLLLLSSLQLLTESRYFDGTFWCIDVLTNTVHVHVMLIVFSKIVIRTYTRSERTDGVDRLKFIPALYLQAKFVNDPVVSGLHEQYCSSSDEPWTSAYADVLTELCHFHLRQCPERLFFGQWFFPSIWLEDGTVDSFPWPEEVERFTEKLMNGKRWLV